MKEHEKILLSHLESPTGNNKELLTNVKQGLGSIGKVVGNPLSKTELTLQVTQNFFRDQIPIPPAALPLNLQSTLPFYLFGLTDFYSGYNRGLNILPLQSKNVDLNLINPLPSGIGWSLPPSLTEYLGAEMVDDSIFYLAPYWSIIGAGWSFLLPKRVHNDGVHGFSSLVKGNFFKPFHKYRITITVTETLNDFSGFLYATGLVGNIVNYLIDHDYVTITADFIPSNDLLKFDSSAFFCSITNVSIKEIIGISTFSGEPSIGIYGYNKNTVFTPTVERGDLVMTYIFRESEPVTVVGYNSEHLYVAEIIVHCTNLPYGTFLNSFSSDLITMDTFRYIVPNNLAGINQLTNPLWFYYQNLFGKLFVDNIDPRLFITPKDFQQQISDIPLHLPINKAVEVGSYMNFNCPMISFVMFVEKVESLTHK